MPTLNGPLPQSVPNSQPPAHAPMGGQPAPDPLANLRDIRLPSDVSAIPAIGWWLLAGLVLIALIAGALLWWQAYQRNRYRRQALAEWQNIGRNQQSAKEKLHLYNALLKRVVRVAYPSVDSAALHGRIWHQFLAQCAPSLDTPDEVQTLFEQGLYRAEQPQGNDLRDLSRYTKQWLEQHRRRLPEQLVHQTETDAGETHAHV